MARQVLDRATNQDIDLLDPPRDREVVIPMTYEEWLAWPPAESRVTEWIDGEVIVFVPGSKLHQDIVGFLYVLLSWYARVEDLGSVIVAPFEMRLFGRVSREPDIIFVAREHAVRLADGKRLDGAADLAIEVISPDSVTRDRRVKMAEYAAAGVREYWLFDARPGHAGSEFYRLGAEGRFEPAAVDADGRYHSSVLPGFWLRPDWLWQDPMPDPVSLLPTIAPEAWRRAFSTPDAE